jgi:hypothetical protein
MKLFKPFFVILLFFSCAENKQKQLIGQDEMKNILYDLMQVDAYIENVVSKDTAINIKQKRSLFYEEVFKLHNTTHKDFYSSYKYYQQHPDIHKVLFDSVTGIAGQRKRPEIRILPRKSVKQNQ